MEFTFLYMLQQLHTDILDRLMVFVTGLGNFGFIWIVLAVVLLFIKKYRRCGTMMLLAMAVGFIFGNLLLKNLIARPRPCWIDSSVRLLIDNPTDFSFPSGHTISSVAAATAIFINSKKAGLIAFLPVALIAFSRMYLFVHFPTDILAGAVIGAMSGGISFWLISKRAAG